MSWHSVLESTAIADDEVIGIQIGGHEIAVYRVAGRVYATSDRCTHGDARLSAGWPEDGCIECPLHQGRFDIATGEGQGAPISMDLRVFPVREEDGFVFVEVI